MNLSEINSTDLTAVYNVEVDSVPTSVPETLKEISFKAKMNEKGMTPDFVTKVVTWSLTTSNKGISTIIEFEDVSETLVNSLILVCHNLTVEAAFLPPNVQTAESEEKYNKVLEAGVSSLMKFKGGAAYVFPICNYLEFMAANVISGCETLEPNDEYTQKYFKEKMTVEFVDTLKRNMANKVYELCGGKEGYEESIMLIAHATSESIKSRLS